MDSLLFFLSFAFLFHYHIPRSSTRSRELPCSITIPLVSSKIVSLQLEAKTVSATYVEDTFVGLIMTVKGIGAGIRAG